MISRLLPYILYGLGSICFLAGSLLSIYNEMHRWPKRMKAKHCSMIVMDSPITPESVAKEIMNTPLYDPDEVRFPSSLDGDKE